MMGSNNNGSNRVVAPEAKQALNLIKLEIANDDSIDRGNLTSRQNGYAGIYVVKNLVDQAEIQNMSNSIPSLNSSTSAGTKELKNEVPKKW